MKAAPKKQPVTVRCVSCAGRYGFGIEDDRPTAYHTLPYCPAFNAIQSTMDALRHAEKCDMAIAAERPSPKTPIIDIE